jgi:predicted ATPase/transcriptional regulator with XRE-family HTH domain
MVKKAAQATPNLWLRDAREERGWTQKDVADRIGAPHPLNISRWESGTAFPRSHYIEQLCLLFDKTPRELGLLHPASAGPGEALRENTAQAPEEPSTIAPFLLPVLLTPLIGREQEVAAVCSELAHPTVRLLTLLGAGGIGKTRLSLQVATQMRNQFADGVCFVPLAPIRDPALVLSAIAQVLDIRENGARPLLEQLKEALRHRQLLLLLDNVEQVVTVAPHLEELLAACPHLKLLVTSRATLHVQAEQIFPVPPLSLPDLLHLPESGALVKYAAVALFLQQARAMQPGFQLTAANAQAVAEICVRLDGLPLAIELAAARIRLLSPQALLGRLSQRLVILTSGPRNLPVRQQTLRNTLTWSYDLLKQEEQQVFRRLSVFEGDWTVEAAEVVGNAHRPPDRAAVSVLDAVASLLDTSLLVQVGKPGEEPRLLMLETVREYGLECLAGSGEEAAVYERHAHYFLTLAEEAEIHLTRPEQEVWLERLSREEANLRAALAWCKATPDAVETGLRLAGALCYYWFLQSALREGRMWLEAMLARTGSTDRSVVRGRALFGAGLLAWAEGDVEAATRCLEESLSICREAGDQRYTSYAEMILGNVLSRQGNNVQARHLSEESHSRLKGLGDDAWDEAFTLYDRGMIAYHSGDPATARAHFEESVRLFRKLGEARYASLVLSFLLVIVASQGDEEMVRSLYQQSLTLMQQARNPGALGLFLINNGEMWLHSYGDEPLAKVLYRLGLSLWQDMQQGGQGIGIVKALAGLAEVAAAQGKAERAGRLFGAAAHLLPSNSLERQDVNGRVAAARVKLDAATFEAGLCAGQAMIQEQAITDALQDGQ